MSRRAPLLTLVAGLVVTGAVLALGPAAVRGGAPVARPARSHTPVLSPATTTAATTSTNPATNPTTVAVAVATATARPAGGVTWAGPIEGGTLALVIRDGRAVAYFCDGRRTEAWLTGTAADGLIGLTGRGGAAATAAFGPSGVSGVIRVGGRARPFAVEDSRAALYRAAPGGADGGWIVQAGNRQVGVLTVGGRTQPAPPLDLVTRTVRVGGRTVTVVPVLP